jgi:hypothetical protein
LGSTDLILFYFSKLPEIFEITFNIKENITLFLRAGK